MKLLFTYSRWYTVIELSHESDFDEIYIYKIAKKVAILQVPFPTREFQSNYVLFEESITGSCVIRQVDSTCFAEKNRITEDCIAPFCDPSVHVCHRMTWLFLERD